MLTQAQKSRINALLWTLLLSTGMAHGAEAMKSVVSVDTVQTMSMPASAEVTGTLYSRDDVMITTAINGRLAWIAEPGSYVAEGQALATFDLVPLQLALAEQKAQLKRAQINQGYQHNEYQRQLKLAETKAVSQFQLEQSRSQFELAQADVEIARLKQQQIEDQIARGEVKAPFAGVVTERLLRAGADVSRGAQLLRFLDTEHLQVRLFVPVKYLGALQLHQQLAVQGNGQRLDGELVAIIPSADTRSQTFEIRIGIPESANERWAAGQLVSVSLPTQNAEARLTVARDALILRRDGTYVVKIDEANKASRLLVQVGKGNKQRVAISGALQAGDRVATRGAERLQDGQQVTVQ